MVSSRTLKRVSIAAGALVGAVLLSSTYAFVHSNVGLSSRSLIDRALDGAVRRGLDFLDRSDRFATSMAQGGHSPFEIWIAKKILAYEEHPGFAEDIRRGWLIGTSGSGRFFTAFPGEKRAPLTKLDSELIAAWISEQRSSYGPERSLSGRRALWGRWIIYAVYPQFRDLIPGDFDRFLSEDWSVSYGYMLTHRLHAYRVFREVNPNVAASFDIRRLEERAQARMYLEMFLDFRVYDLYFERLAFLMEGAAVPHVPARWVERVLLDQNEDGGWATHPSLRCELKRMITPWSSTGPCGRRTPDRTTSPDFHETLCALATRGHEWPGLGAIPPTRHVKEFVDIGSPHIGNTMLLAVAVE
jgi:hypothetical protein